MSEQNSIPVSGAELSQYLGISVSRIDKLRREKIIEYHPTEPNKYDLQQTVHAYCGRLRDQAAGRMSGLEKATEEASEVDGKIKYDPIQEKARLTALQADLADIKLQTIRGEMMPMSDMLEVIQRVLGSARSKIMALPTALPMKIHSMGKQEVEVVKDVVYEILEELSEDASTIHDQVRENALEDEK